MKKRFQTYAFKIGVVTALLTAIPACNAIDNLLDTESETSLTSKNIFDSPERIEGLVNGAYRSLKTVDLYGGRFLMLLDVRGEEFINVTANSYSGFDSWANSYSSASNDINSLWSQAYTAINNANIIIEGLTESEGVVTDQEKQAYIGEARFIRALAYYALVTIYARPYGEDNGASKALPLRLIAETSSDNNDLARSTVAEVYGQIIKDLDFAEEYLPETRASAELNTTRAHRNTAIALKTRVYLSQGKFPAVVEEAKKIVPQTAAPFAAATGVAHTLQPDITTIFGGNYTTTESIFSLPMTASDSYTGQNTLAYLYYTNGDYYLNPAGVLSAGTWGDDDDRRKLLTESKGNVYLAKYAKSSPFTDYIPVIRYAEVLLNYAEAAARTGNPTLAVELVQAVHQRSDPGFVFAPSEVGTADALLQTIRLERRIELLGEGFRSNDLLRDLLTIPAKRNNNYQAREIKPAETGYIFPLPDSERATNKLL